MRTILLLFIFAGFFLQSCNKDRMYLNGKAVIAGKFVYKDAENGPEHAVSNLQIRLIFIDENNEEAILFDRKLENGIFRFESLNKGDYRFEATYKVGEKEYSCSSPFHLNDTDYIADSVFVLLPTSVTTQLSGNVTFSNLLTGTTSPAVTATIHLLNASMEEVAATTVQSNGKYELNGIEPGNYTLKAQLSTLPDAEGDPVVYIQTVQVTIGSVHVTQNLQLEWNTEGTLLRIHVTDSIQNPISGAQTCIYNNQNFMLNNLYSCNGSQRSGNVSVNGNILFSGLSAVRYYISATQSVGSIDLYSDSLEATPAAIIPGVLNTRTVELRQQW